MTGIYNVSTHIHNKNHIYSDYFIFILIGHKFV